MVSFAARSSPRVNVLVVPGIETRAVSSAGSAEGGGGPPGGGGGVYAQSGRPGGMGPVGAGAACCCATLDAPNITTATATSAPTALRMFPASIRGEPELAGRSLHPEAIDRFDL